jgi:hypothetical protein
MPQTLKPVGEWLGESFAALRGRVVTLALLSIFGFFAIVLGVAMVYALGIAAYGSMQGWDNVMRLLSDPQRVQYLIEESGRAIALLNVLAIFVAIRISSWVMLASIHASMVDSLGVREALRKGRERGYAFIGLIVLHQIIVSAGFVLLIVPGIILAVRLGFASCAFAKEGGGVVQSLRDSAGAVKGRFLAVLGRMILVGLLGSLMMIVPVLGWLVGGAWILVAWSLLYENLRGPAASPARARVAPRPGIVYPPAPQRSPAR